MFQEKSTKILPPAPINHLVCVYTCIYVCPTNNCIQSADTYKVTRLNIHNEQIHHLLISSEEEINFPFRCVRPWQNISYVQLATAQSSLFISSCWSEPATDWSWSIMNKTFHKIISNVPYKYQKWWFTSLAGKYKQTFLMSQLTAYFSSP